ncbi:glucose-1-phosphate cytidylyltransferase [uncultured Methylovirgula sp.]|uniref:glucose-1-phosphate cytidylyltransferase n=1 Tax=uncultured Methylovirgula sp. TaxID=1285960 RepID=UPI00261D36EF|nr:glucose-1-phosphate cytidylyltransferase [uncultured Methylovirgula sp.]
MKAVILAGGKGSRLSEETVVTPKPLIEIGGRPILWHIMKIYAAHGIRRFVICLGYKGFKIKEYFLNYGLHNVDVTIETRGGLHIHQEPAEDWEITLAETGEETMTGGRIRRIARYLQDDDLFCLTYGDGVADVDIAASLAFHRSHGKLATVTAVRPLARFGSLDIEAGAVRRFVEKPVTEGGLINGGFFVLSPKVIDYIAGDETLWEKEPLENLARDQQLMAFEHDGFWQPMDTLRDRHHLEELWAKGRAPWRIWDDVAPREIAGGKRRLA